MVPLAKLWIDYSVNNFSKYLIFLAIHINLLLWGCDRWSLCTSLLKNFKYFYIAEYEAYQASRWMR